MSATELLRLIIQADTAGAVRGLEAVGSSADKNLGRAQDRTDRLAANLTKFGAVAVSAGAVVAAGLFKAGEAASNLGEQVSQSQQIFGDAAGEIGSFAKGAAGSLGQSERAAREAANSFGLFFTNAGKSKTEAAAMSIELSKLASDMASFKNTSPEDAVQALTSALSGETEPMKRYGVFLQDATLKQRALAMGLEWTGATLPPVIKQQAIYAEILAQTGTIQGDFERTSGSLANQQRILSAEFENAKAAIGQGALPVLTKLTGVAADAASGFASLDQKTGGAVGTLATMATGALLVGGGLSMAVGQAIKMRDNLAHLKGPFVAAEGGMTRLGKATAALGLAGAVVGLAAMAKESTGLKVDVDQLTVALNRTDKASRDQLQGMVLVAKRWGDLDEMVSRTADTNVLAAERLLEVAEAAGISGDELDRLRTIVDDKRAADVQGTKDQAAYSDQVNEAAASTEEFAAEQETAAEKVERLNGELEDATEAITKNYQAMHRGTDLAMDYEAGIDDLIEALKENGTTLDLTTEKGRANAQQAITTGEAIAGLIQKRYEETGSVEAAAQAGDLYVANLRNQLREAGFTEGAIESLIAQMHLTPGEIRTNILADTAAASKAVADFQAQLAKVAATKVFAAIGATVPGGWGWLPTLPKHASGTPNFRGGMTWVGERGPEIVDLPAGSRIHDNATSMAMASRGGGVGTIVIPVSIGGREIDRIVVDANARTVRRGVG